MSWSAPIELFPTFGVLWQEVQVAVTREAPARSLKPATPETMKRRPLKLASPLSIDARAAVPAGSEVPCPRLKAGNNWKAPGLKAWEPVPVPHGSLIPA